MLNTQRDKVYLDRRRALGSRDLSPLLVEYAERTVDDILEVSHSPRGSPAPLLITTVSAVLQHYCTCSSASVRDTKAARHMHFPAQVTYTRGVAPRVGSTAV